MSAQPLDTSGYRHYLRVRLGVNGPSGRLMRCQRKTGPGVYWKVRLETGEWVWPADLIQEHPGECVARCAECDMRFLCAKVEPLCPYCNEAMFGTQQRASEPGAINDLPTPRRQRLPREDSR